MRSECVTSKVMNRNGVIRSGIGHVFFRSFDISPVFFLFFFGGGGGRAVK